MPVNGSGQPTRNAISTTCPCRCSERGVRSVSGVEVEGHLWTQTGRGHGWRLGPEVEVSQDPANDRWIGQQRHQLSSASASMSTQDVDREHPAHQLRPAVGMRTGRWGRWSWRGRAGLCSGVQESEETCEPDALGCGLGRAGGLAVCTDERTGWCVAGGGGGRGVCVRRALLAHNVRTAFRLVRGRAGFIEQGRWRRNEYVSPTRGWSQHSVVGDQVHTRPWNPCREPLDEGERGELRRGWTLPYE